MANACRNTEGLGGVTSAGGLDPKGIPKEEIFNSVVPPQFTSGTKPTPRASLCALTGVGLDPWVVAHHLSCN